MSNCTHARTHVTDTEIQLQMKSNILMLNHMSNLVKMCQTSKCRQVGV